MSIDYNALALPKGQTKADAKATRDKLRQKIDRAENAKVKARSGGRCEVMVVSEKATVGPWTFGGGGMCQRRSVPGVHHMIGGWGKRARGKSLLADHKQDVCQQCHDLITSHRLRRVGGDEPRWSDCYVRVK